MATVMPPWVDWLDYFGADAIGRVVGLWLKFCFGVPKLVLSRLRILSRNEPKLADVNYPASTHSEMSGWFRSGFSKIIKIVMATLLTLVIWAIATSKSVWTAAGTDGDRILAGLLMLVSATWVMSVFWIFLSRTRKKRIAIGPHR